jgi:hypothetical protein
VAAVDFSKTVNVSRAPNLFRMVLGRLLKMLKWHVVYGNSSLLLKRDHCTKKGCF